MSLFQLLQGEGRLHPLTVEELDRVNVLSLTENGLLSANKMKTKKSPFYVMWAVVEPHDVSNQ